MRLNDIENDDIEMMINTAGWKWHNQPSGSAEPLQYRPKAWLGSPFSFQTFSLPGDDDDEEEANDDDDDDEEEEEDDDDTQIPNLSLAFYARQSLIKTCLSDEQYSNTYMFNEFKQIQREFNALEWICNAMQVEKRNWKDWKKCFEWQIWSHCQLVVSIENIHPPEPIVRFFEVKYATAPSSVAQSLISLINSCKKGVVWLKGEK